MSGNPLADAVEEARDRLLKAHGGLQDPVGVWGLSETRLAGFADAVAQYVGARVGPVTVDTNERCDPLLYVTARHPQLGVWSFIIAVFPA